MPRPLLGGSTEQLSADRIARQQPRLAVLAHQQRRQVMGQGGLAAARRTDQLVAAQGWLSHRTILGSDAAAA